MDAPRRFRVWLGRVGLILFGCVAALVLLEAVLQVSSWIVGATADRHDMAWSRDSVRVLCLGDSNTFGVYLRPEDSYPAQLESLWNGSMSPPQLDVINLGYPGMSSSKVLKNVESMFDTFLPDVVLLMVGANDFWTSPVEVSDEPVPFWKRHSRLYRLYLILSAPPVDMDIIPWAEPNASRDHVDTRVRVGNVELDMGWDRADREGLKNRVPLHENLQELVERARQRGFDLRLMTYPSRLRFYNAANTVIRYVAAKSDVPLIDLEKAFETHCPDAACPNLLFDDGHPRKDGYEIVATLIAEHLATDRER